MSCRIVNEVKTQVPEELLKKCALEALSEAEQPNASCTVVLVSPEKMKELNLQYSGKNSPTNVLSFSSDEKGYIGDIVLCPAFIKDNSHNFRKELCHLTAHGILHLIGMSHDTEEDYQKMHNLEEKIIKKTL